jgi:hypothetical protein
MDFRNTMISDSFPCSSIYYNLDDLKTLNEDNAIESPVGCVTWIGDKPEVIDNLDNTIRTKFNVPENFKMVFRLYKPPQFGLSKPIISKPSKRMEQRIIVSTIHESPSISFGITGKSQLFKMKAGEAYSIPYPINNMISIEFDDKRTLIIPARKGHRQQKRTKRIEKRYVMIFDYVYTDDIQDAVEELIS